MDDKVSLHKITNSLGPDDFTKAVKDKDNKDRTLRPGHRIADILSGQCSKQSEQYTDSFLTQTTSSKANKEEDFEKNNLNHFTARYSLYQPDCRKNVLIDPSRNDSNGCSSESSLVDQSSFSKDGDSVPLNLGDSHSRTLAKQDRYLPDVGLSSQLFADRRLYSNGSAVYTDGSVLVFPFQSIFNPNARARLYGDDGAVNEKSDNSPIYQKSNVETPLDSVSFPLNMVCPDEEEPNHFLFHPYRQLPKLKRSTFGSSVYEDETGLLMAMDSNRFLKMKSLLFSNGYATEGSQNIHDEKLKLASDDKTIQNAHQSKEYPDVNSDTIKKIKLCGVNQTYSRDTCLKISEKHKPSVTSCFNSLYNHECASYLQNQTFRSTEAVENHASCPGLSIDLEKRNSESKHVHENCEPDVSRHFFNPDVSSHSYKPSHTGRNDKHQPEATFKSTVRKLIEPDNANTISGDDATGVIEDTTGREAGLCPLEVPGYGGTDGNNFRVHDGLGKVTLTQSGVTVTLLNNSLWSTFNEMGTEMVINRGGRRMFPYLALSVSGLRSRGLYNVELSILPASTRRFKYIKSKWVPVGLADAEPPQAPYVHSDSPNTGEHWNKSKIVFSKVKLTNNKDSSDRNILLHSMQKYRILTTFKPIDNSVETPLTFTFPETEFMAVTAYQNENVTQMKIYNNPFAKAFRDNTYNSARRPGSHWKKRERANAGFTKQLSSFSADPVSRRKRDGAKRLSQQRGSSSRMNYHHLWKDDPTSVNKSTGLQQHPTILNPLSFPPFSASLQDSKGTQLQVMATPEMMFGYFPWLSWYNPLMDNRTAHSNIQLMPSQVSGIDLRSTGTTESVNESIKNLGSCSTDTTDGVTQGNNDKGQRGVAIYRRDSDDPSTDEKTESESFDETVL